MVKPLKPSPAAGSTIDKEQEKKIRQTLLNSEEIQAYQQASN